MQIEDCMEVHRETLMVASGRSASVAAARRRSTCQTRIDRARSCRHSTKTMKKTRRKRGASRERKRGRCARTTRSPAVGPSDSPTAESVRCPARPRTASRPLLHSTRRLQRELPQILDPQSQSQQSRRKQSRRRQSQKAGRRGRAHRPRSES